MAKACRKAVRNEEECCQIGGQLNLPSAVAEELDRAGGLDAVLESLPSDEELARRSAMYQALSDPMRVRIMCALMKCALCPCLFKEMTDLSDSRLSYHLNVLEEAGLIMSRPQKKWRIYVLTDRGRALLDGLD
jgi:ArsR family transcriptional regulator, arsenate/arsenite/antimonite-responsive transcriptional repressor